MDFGSEGRVQAVQGLVEAMFEHVLYDEDPVFVGDLATILDVSTASPEELSERIAYYYGATVSIEDLRRPLWQLLPELEKARQRPSSAR